jgi:hypothetical protein
LASHSKRWWKTANYASHHKSHQKQNICRSNSAFHRKNQEGLKIIWN